jgi:hypothetical protein
MPAAPFAYRLLDNSARPDRPPGGMWVWDGYLARGDVALLTGLWKTGKTTLLTGLLSALGGGGSFLGRGCAAGGAVVVSEESDDHWADRRAAIPVGPHARLVSRPFPGRPTPREWGELVGWVEGMRAEGAVDLLAVDPLAAFLPGRSDADAATLLDFLGPLRRVAAGGTAVLVLHHPRREKSEEGSTARGGGALLGSVDVNQELHHVGRGRAGNRRRLTARSRRAAPADVVYEWAPGTAEFRVVPDDPESRFRENWDAVRELLAGRPAPASHHELLADWPTDESAPTARLLYDWLRRAAAAGLAVRTGRGTKTDPFRFALPRPPAPTGLPVLGPVRV